MVIISRVRQFIRSFWDSLLLRIELIILVLTIILLLIQAISPVKTTEDMIFTYKQSMILGKAETIASSLNTNLQLSREGAEEVVSVLGSSDVGQIVITDAEGVVLYSTNTSLTPTGACVLYPEILSALRGNNAFRCIYTIDAFESYGAIPIMVGNVITGCVYVAESDREQAALLMRIQQNALHMSAITIVVSLILSIVTGIIITKKSGRLHQSIQQVRAGDYSHRVEVTGNDEYARLANEFNALTDRLQATEEGRRQFVSDASHELRTPLAAIRLLSDSIIQNDLDRDTIREFVQDISSESDRLTRMTSKLLNLTALDSRQFMQQEPEQVDLGQCCKKAVRMLTPFAKEVGATLEESSEEHCCILAREDDIFQIILNLAENGIKYSESGGEVRLIAYAQGETAVLIVEDNGIGIPEEELDQIFERFYRVDKARSREAGGTGLGLAIVRETVEKFGGNVIASNRPQGGARFTVHFPLYQWEGEP